jgi:Right handed beta helix region
MLKYESLNARSKVIGCFALTIAISACGSVNEVPASARASAVDFLSDSANSAAKESLNVVGATNAAAAATAVTSNGVPSMSESLDSGVVGSVTALKATSLNENPDGKVGLDRTAAPQSFLIASGSKQVVPDSGFYSPKAFNHCAASSFPQQWSFGAPQGPEAAVAPATEQDGFKPEIRQIRNGKVVAIYSSFGNGGGGTSEYNPNKIDPSGGAFSRKPYAMYEEGDIYEVYPAVYKGEDQQPWIGPQARNAADYNAGKVVYPTNITIRGITVNGKRPVIKLAGISSSNNTLGQGPIYVGESTGVVIENLEIDGNNAVYNGKAGIYIAGAKDLTLRDLKIHGFRGTKTNGVFGAYTNSGTLTMERLEVFGNGGDNGPEHNFYINASQLDPNYKVILRNSWSYDVYYGHLFKSRAQNTVLEGNYFMGTRSTGIQTETYAVDVPDGGNLVMRNNILVKNYSGDNSNGTLLTFGVERAVHASTSIVAEHNTFITFDKFYDSAKRQIHPIRLAVDPVTGATPYPVSVKNNVYAGFCPTWDNRNHYYGSAFHVLGLSELDSQFSPFSKLSAKTGGVVGLTSYRHAAKSGVRVADTVGARD